MQSVIPQLHRKQDNTNNQTNEPSYWPQVLGIATQTHMHAHTQSSKVKDTQTKEDMEEKALDIWQLLHHYN